MSHPLLGYFDDLCQTEPAYDPPHDGPCIVCMKPLTPDTVRTVSLMDGGPGTGRDFPARSWFYRLHRACDDSLTDFERGELDHSVVHSEPPEASE